ncbi:hypothetical protein DFH09DRAFT_1336259 [Mycena vulgaris]|nr:hypothetical protein DFH09DRAFT_1336259 [Mycena vulgaris]
MPARRVFLAHGRSATFKSWCFAVTRNPQLAVRPLHKTCLPRPLSPVPFVLHQTTPPPLQVAVLVQPTHSRDLPGQNRSTLRSLLKVRNLDLLHSHLDFFTSPHTRPRRDVRDDHDATVCSCARPGTQPQSLWSGARIPQRRALDPHAAHSDTPAHSRLWRMCGERQVASRAASTSAHRAATMQRALPFAGGRARLRRRSRVFHARAESAASESALAVRAGRLGARRAGTAVRAPSPPSRVPGRHHALLAWGRAGRCVSGCRCAGGGGMELRSWWRWCFHPNRQEATEREARDASGETEERRRAVESEKDANGCAHFCHHPCATSPPTHPPLDLDLRAIPHAHFLAPRAPPRIVR